MEGSSLYSVAFTAELPALGYATYFVSSSSSSDATVAEEPEEQEVVRDTTVTNGIYTLTMSAATGRITTIAANGITMPFSQVLD